MNQHGILRPSIETQQVSHIVVGLGIRNNNEDTTDKCGSTIGDPSEAFLNKEGGALYT